MAQKVITQLIDDIDGRELQEGDGETVTFSLDNADYKIDLSLKNADALRGEFQDYIARGRKVTGQRSSSKRRASIGGDAKAIRAWAQENGIKVPERGRIPADVREQHEKVV